MSARIERAAVIGAGTMGTGIAMTLSNAGLAVLLIDSNSDALERSRSTLERTYAQGVERGRFSPDEGAARQGRIQLQAGDANLSTVDLAIEAVFEDLALKREVFVRLGARCRADALLATNTSTLDVDAIAAAAPDPARSLGLHFFSPAHIMKLLEIVRGRATSEATLSAALELAQRLGKVAVVVGNAYGFVGNRMLHAYRREAELLLEAGATPQQVDAALERFGFAMGPFSVADLAGVDIGWRAKMERLKAETVPFRLSNIVDRLVAARRLGQKSGAGYYRYAAGDRTPLPDAAVDDIIAAERATLGVAARSVSDDEIVRRTLAALINEGARLLDTGIARSAADIDTIWVNGYGFPKARGGPMRYASESGPARILADVREFAQTDPEFWKPARSLEAAAAAGTFDGATDGADLSSGR